MKCVGLSAILLAGLTFIHTRADVNNQLIMPDPILGAGRGVPGNWHPYRDHSLVKDPQTFFSRISRFLPCLFTY